MAAVLVILGTVFVLGPLSVSKRRPAPCNDHRVIQEQSSAVVDDFPARTNRPAFEPLPPRLLPHGELIKRHEEPAAENTAVKQKAIRRVAFPHDEALPQNQPSGYATAADVLPSSNPIGPPRRFPERAALARRVQTPPPATQTAQRASQSADTGPRYSWLLENQAAMPADSGQRSVQLERIACEADSHTRHGFSLANRGAYYSARAEFIATLQLIAQGLDVEHQTSVHSRALRAGLTALDEADDFITTGSQLESDLDFRAIIGSHNTPVLKLSRPQTLTSLEALRRYFSFAQYQLGVAGGGEVAASMALHAMAKLYASAQENHTVNVPSAQPKAMTCYQAALVCYPGNYLAANDLGVLLAGSGRYKDARKVLEAAAAAGPHSSIWHNLAVVYERLGLSDEALQARQNHQLSLQHESTGQQARLPGATDPRVCWLSPEEFAKTYGQTLDARQPLPTSQTQKIAEVQESQPSRRQIPSKNPSKITPQSQSKTVESDGGPVIESQSTTRWSWNILDRLFK